MITSPDHLIWIDLEMTGLDPERCHILEIATLVTDARLELVAEGPSLVVHADSTELETLSDWSREQFARTGLLEEVRRSTISRAEAEERTLAFLTEHCIPGASPLCGSSVHHDRAFLRREMRRLHDFAHYRNVDVSTIKELVRRWYPGLSHPPKKAETHRALLDIQETVAELSYYRSRFFRDPESGIRS